MHLSGYAAKHSGMFHPIVKVGQKVEKGTELGEYFGPVGYFGAVK